MNLWLFLSYFSILQELVEVNKNNPASTIVTLTALVISFCIFSPTDSAAEAVKAMQWQIDADKLTRFEDPPSIIAEGNVILTKTQKITRQKVEVKKNDWGDLIGTFEKPEQETGQPDQEDETIATSKTIPSIGTPDDVAATASQVKDEENDEGETTTTTKVITTIKADWMVYDVDLGTVKVRGNVLIDIGADHLTAEEGVVNLNRETGTFENATIIRQYKDMHFEGRVIEKTGDLSYHIEDGWLITCKLKEGQTPPWSFKAADAKITDGGYAFLKHAVFRIKKVPIFYTPIMILPAKRTRQTGFLFPSISVSERDGFGIEFPFFINLSPSSDITLYSNYMVDRGFMGGVEGRYMLNPGSKGMIMGNYLNDSLSDIKDPDNADYYKDGGYTHDNQDRYWIRAKADHDIGEWTTRLDIDLVSDRDYLTEFNTGLTGYNMSDARFSNEFGRGFQNRTEDKRHSTLRALRSWDNGLSLQGNMEVTDDLRVVENSPTPLMKLPEVNFTGLLPIYETGIDFSWNANYLHYYREEGVSAHRIDLFPRLTMAVPLLSDYIETLVAVGVRDTMYSIDNNTDTQPPELFPGDNDNRADNDETSLSNTVATNIDDEYRYSDTENRFLADFRAEIASTLKRDFAWNGSSVSTWSHTVRPFIRYKYITDVDQDHLPQFDSIDDVGDQNLITYGINNFFNVFGNSNNVDFDREYGYLKIEQKYDLREVEEDTPFSPVEIRLGYFPLQELRFVYKTDIDVYDDGFLKHTVEADYFNSRGDLFSADYFYDLLADSSSIRGEMRIGLFYNLFAGYAIEQSIEDSITVEERFKLIYSPSCWSVELGADTTPGNEKYTIMFRLANIGTPFGMGIGGAGQ